MPTAAESYQLGEEHVTSIRLVWLWREYSALFFVLMDVLRFAFIDTNTHAGTGIHDDKLDIIITMLFSVYTD